MSFEQYWTVPPCRSQDVVDALRAVADPHMLKFWTEIQGDRVVVWVQFDVDDAAELAAALSDIYTVDQAAAELDELEGDIDMAAATLAGAVTVREVGTTRISRIAPEDAEQFRQPAPTHYTCRFDVVWREDPPVIVYSNDGDNRAGWPAIIAFADAVVERLGGGWVER